jgi:signal transduction histidine kinase
LLLEDCVSLHINSTGIKHMSVNLLARMPFFVDVPPDELDLLASASEVVNLKSGDILFREGDLGNHLFVVSSGVLEVLTGLNTVDELLVSLLGEGEYLGEVSLILSDSRRTASVRAREDVVLLSLSRSNFVEWFQRNPLLAFPIIQTICKRDVEKRMSLYRNLLEKDQLLQQAHQRLVTVVEEERRRLRRDLHDGLGPALASLGLKLAAAKQLLRRDSDSVESLLDQVMAQNLDMVSEVRRLVYGLRPPVLDERGLAEAIRAHVLNSQSDGLQIEVGELPNRLPHLPAAVEVAAYRIALEALTNVFRHAQARRCTIQFAEIGTGRATALQIEIVDDGIGLPRELRAGVGLRSMRERAEELGGTCVIESEEGNGTRVCVKLPLIGIEVSVVHGG